MEESSVASVAFSHGSFPRGHGGNSRRARKADEWNEVLNSGRVRVRVLSHITNALGADLSLHGEE